MIDRKTATEQVERLGGLDWYPREARPLAELVDAVQAAESEFIAAYVVGEWIHDQRECPKPADLRRLIWEENEKRKVRLADETPVVSSGCKTCQGFGYYGGAIGGKFNGPWKLCSCPAGTPEAQAVVDHANAAREKLIRRFGPKANMPEMLRRAAKVQTIISDAEAYSGDFWKS